MYSTVTQQAMLDPASVEHQGVHRPFTPECESVGTGGGVGGFDDASCKPCVVYHTGGSELAKKLIDVYLTLFSLIMTGKVGDGASNTHSLPKTTVLSAHHGMICLPRVP